MCPTEKGTARRRRAGEPTLDQLRFVSERVAVARSERLKHGNAGCVLDSLARTRSALDQWARIAEARLAGMAAAPQPGAARQAERPASAGRNRTATGQRRMLPGHLLALRFLHDVVADSRSGMALKSSFDRPDAALISAAAKGELRPVPSRATLPGCVEKLMSVPMPDSTAARPRPMSADRVPIARARLRDKGLSLHASRNSSCIGQPLHHAVDYVHLNHLEFQGRGASLARRRSAPDSSGRPPGGRGRRRRTNRPRHPASMPAKSRILRSNACLPRSSPVDDLETLLPQNGADIARVIPGVWSVAANLIGRVAHHQRDTLLRPPLIRRDDRATNSDRNPKNSNS